MADISRMGKLKSNVDDSEILQSIRNKREWYFTETRNTRRQWLVNAAFTRSQQWSAVHRTDDRLVNLQAPPGRKRVTVDRMRPWKWKTTADLVTARPMFKAEPDNLSSNSVTSARMGSALLQHYWENWQFILQYVKLCGYMIDFGNAFVYLNYMEDNSKYISRPVTDPDTGGALLDSQNEPVVERSAIGDITAAMLPPQNVAMPLDDCEFDDKPWVIIHQSRPLEYFPENYPDNGDEVKAESSGNQDYYNLGRIRGDTQTLSESMVNNYADEVVYFQKPCATNDKGMVITTANGVMLDRAEWPYKRMDTYPIIHFHYPKDSGEFLARAPVEPQIPIQKCINLLASTFMENAEDMAHLKWLVANGAGVDSITDANETVRYNYPFEPKQADIKSMPAYVMELLQYFDSAMRDVQNYHGSSMGTSVSGVRSDVHAQNLQDQDMLPLQVVDNMMQAGFERMGEKILAIAAEKLSEERMITYTGKDRRTIVEKFRGDMLGDVTKVRVRMTNVYMRNKAAVTNNILEMYQIGMISNQYGMPDGIRALRLLEFALPDSAFQEMQVHTDSAYRENDTMLEGNPAQPLPWQNHPMHLSVHQDFMNSPEFMTLIETVQDNPQNEQIIGLFTQHLQATQAMFSEALRGMQPQEGSRTQEEAGKPPQAKQRETSQ